MNYIISAVLLTVMAFVFLHSECGLFTCSDSDHHETHDFCRLVKMTDLTHNNVSRIHVDLEPILILSPVNYILPESKDFPVTSGTRELKIPPKDILHINSAFLI